MTSLNRSFERRISWDLHAQSPKGLDKNVSISLDFFLHVPERRMENSSKGDLVSRLNAETMTTTLMMTRNPHDLFFFLFAPFARIISLTFRALRSFRKSVRHAGPRLDRGRVAEKERGSEGDNGLARKGRKGRKGGKGGGGEGCYRRISERTLARYERR